MPMGYLSSGYLLVGPTFAQDRLKLLFDFAVVFRQAVKRGKSRGDFEKCWTFFCTGVAIEIQIEHRQRRDEIEGSVDVGT